MNNNPDKKNWFDVKVFIATLGFLFTMWLWNSFSKELVKTSLAKIPPTNYAVPGTPVSTPVNQTVQPTPFTRILMGGAAPQVYQADRQASQPITQTSSSR
ncbi:MAG: hypothetical protein WBV22_06885 [Anaerolineaceae bacterium]